MPVSISLTVWGILLCLFPVLIGQLCLIVFLEESILEELYPNGQIMPLSLMWPWGARDRRPKKKKVFPRSLWSHKQLGATALFSQRIVWKSLLLAGVTLMASGMPWAVWALMRSFQVGGGVGLLPSSRPTWPFRSHHLDGVLELRGHLFSLKWN